MRFIQQNMDNLSIKEIIAILFLIVLFIFIIPISLYHLFNIWFINDIAIKISSIFSLLIVMFIISIVIEIRY